jgi:extracellular factor (EF) 3-hydroxypalmitic acid methyl ester biosynthesis protein
MDSPRTPQPHEIAGDLEALGGLSLPIQVLQAAPHTLFIKFLNGDVPHNRAEFTAVLLRAHGRELTLGRCRFHSHAANPARRKEDPPLVGDGRIVFLDDLYDFTALTRTGLVFELRKRLEQLPVLWGRKLEIRPRFREFVAELVYDLQVYRGIFDEIDRNLVDEPYGVKADVHRVVTSAEYATFKELFDQKLAELESHVKDFSKEEHERHGFYFRKHVWDIIRASEFLLRTNLKPRGYAGDSVMMRMIYENQFRGPTIFSRFVHRHPIEAAAAEAVRNRVTLLSNRIAGLAAAHTRGGPRLRIMSVACGPAWELREVFRTPEDFDRFEVTLLDQDAEALAEARLMIARLETSCGVRLRARFVQESVRTMLRTADLSARWGRFTFLYSMGLFDYLTTPVAQVVLQRLYDLLEPGGELVIGNFHVKSISRVYMEYWMDWVLLYRTEKQFRELAQGLPGAETSIVFEETASQMFLSVRKGEQAAPARSPRVNDE